MSFVFHGEEVRRYYFRENTTWLYIMMWVVGKLSDEAWCGHKILKTETGSVDHVRGYDGFWRCMMLSEDWLIKPS